MPEPLETISYEPDYYAGVEDEFMPPSLTTLQVTVFPEEDERFVRLSIECNGQSIMFMMHVCADHARCIIDGYLAGFERGYAQARDDAEEEFIRYQRNHAHQ